MPGRHQLGEVKRLGMLAGAAIGGDAGMRGQGGAGSRDVGLDVAPDRHRPGRSRVTFTGKPAGDLELRCLACPRSGMEPYSFLDFVAGFLILVGAFGFGGGGTAAGSASGARFGAGRLIWAGIHRLQCWLRTMRWRYDAPVAWGG